MNEMTEVAVCKPEELSERRGKKVTAEGEEIALFLHEGTVCAISNRCPHQQFQKLHEGMYENGIVTCPMHGWAYDVRTGISVNASGRVRIYETEIQNGNVVVKMP